MFRMGLLHPAFDTDESSIITTVKQHVYIVEFIVRVKALHNINQTLGIYGHLGRQSLIIIIILVEL